MPNLRIELEMGELTSTDLQNRTERADKWDAMAQCMLLLKAVAGGNRNAVLHTQVCGAIAGVLIGCDVSDAVDGTDDLTIAAGATTATISVEASPSGEDQMDGGTTDAEFADNLAAAINAHSVLSTFVRAVSDGVSAVAVYALTAGPIGHGVTLSKTGNGFTLGGAALAGGTASAPMEYGFGYV